MDHKDIDHLSENTHFPYKRNNTKKKKHSNITVMKTNRVNKNKRINKKENTTCMPFCRQFTYLLSM